MLMRLIKGKHKEDEAPPDAELAASLYKLELESLATFYSDRLLCRRINNPRLGGSNQTRDRHHEEQQCSTIEQQYVTNATPTPEMPSIAVTPEAVVDDDGKSITTEESSFTEEAHVGTSTPVTSPNEAAEAIEQRRCGACMTDVPVSETMQCYVLMTTVTDV
ncbi:ibr finger domain-containing [Trichoderma arundinaceum]|uniref:Ibr finger domain-containing n=1 Tax=Trichoderma arundinaceum TaxID=490622 RepID=A0A395NXI2_TRIAR|nr:ibr finger domain-containing [Trichoderma arundinaceum]